MTVSASGVPALTYPGFVVGDGTGDAVPVGAGLWFGSALCVAAGAEASGEADADAEAGASVGDAVGAGVAVAGGPWSHAGGFPDDGEGLGLGVWLF